MGGAKIAQLRPVIGLERPLVAGLRVFGGNIAFWQFLGPNSGAAFFRAGIALGQLLRRLGIGLAFSGRILRHFEHFAPEARRGYLPHKQGPFAIGLLPGGCGLFFRGFCVN